jgi:hypothetical protein
VTWPAKENLNTMKWEDPKVKPGKGGPPVKWLAEAEELRKRPGQWAVLVTLSARQRGSSSRWVCSIKQGERKAFRPPGSFEALQQLDGDVIKIYVRYVGEDS